MSQPRTAIITGSSNGIGAAIALEFARKDYKLVVTGRSKLDLDDVASKCAELSPSKHKPLKVIAEMTKEEDIERLVAESLKFLDNKLNVLVNNHGGGGPVLINSDDVPKSYSNFANVIQMNFMSVVKLVMLCSKALIETAKEERKTVSNATSCIINMSSVLGKRSLQSYVSAYSASKAAMNSFTRSAAAELSPYVRVNSICPGPVMTKIIDRSGGNSESFKAAATSMLPLARIGEGHDVAYLAEFLADPIRASFITGSDYVIDGGLMIRPIYNPEKQA